VDPVRAELWLDSFASHPLSEGIAGLTDFSKLDMAISRLVICGDREDELKIPTIE
jgi:hypothetical protein